MSAWIFPAAGYILVTGLLGVTTKLALRDIEWPEILLWSSLVYAVAGLAVLVFGDRTIHLGAGTGWGLVTGLCAMLGLACAFLALRDADASLVVPVMSVYPLVTVVVSMAVLDEAFSVARAVGAALIVTGVILLSQ